MKSPDQPQPAASSQAAKKTPAFVDLPTMRRQLADMREREANDRRLWRSLEDFSTPITDAGRSVVADSNCDDDEGTAKVERRDFFKLMGGSMALAGLTACTKQPIEKIVPYVDAPEDILPGKPLFYATSYVRNGLAEPILAESHMGRPTKIEGNPEHPVSNGSTTIYSQASILDLYDPERSKAVRFNNRISSLEEFQNSLNQAFENNATGKGFAILMERHSSPTLASLMGQFLSFYKDAKIYLHEPGRSSAVGNHSDVGCELAFGKKVTPRYNLAKAKLIVDLDSNLLCSGPDQLNHMAGWSAGRDLISQANLKPPAGNHDNHTQDPHAAHEKGDHGDKGDAGHKGEGKQPAHHNLHPKGRYETLERPTLSRMYAVETDMTPTGVVADHRLAASPSTVMEIAGKIARSLGVEVAGLPEHQWSVASKPVVQDERNHEEYEHDFISALLEDLKAAGADAVVTIGERHPPEAHALVAAINEKISSKAVTYLASPWVELNVAGSVVDLTQAMRAGEVETLLILDSNPAYSTPADLEFSNLVTGGDTGRRAASLVIHVGHYLDETAVLADWHIPLSHYLEAWGDARSVDGAYCTIQPLIQPLYGTISLIELFQRLTGNEDSAADLVRKTAESLGKGEGDEFWLQTLHDGFVKETAFTPEAGLSAKAVPLPKTQMDDGLEIVFALDPTLGDGRHAHNLWLQELPNPVSTLSWDNAAVISPRTARDLKLQVTRSGYPKRTAVISTVHMVKLTLGNREIEMALMIQPGHADDCITVTFGHGRELAGPLGSQTGFNAYSFQPADMSLVASGAQMEKSYRKYPLALTQDHFVIEGRWYQVRNVTLHELNEDPNAVTHQGHEFPDQYNLYKTADRMLTDEVQWGMVVDMNRCTACNACLIACQSENNIPVVGKDQVMRGREMYWNRIDRYYEGDPFGPNVRVRTQPVACVHCELAPCETVCPVGATVHSNDGLNQMVYNRCVGTRYCSNNCPYKVRRYNYYQFVDRLTESVKLGRNPDVTVRSRGVMEKCTYCIQRINAARIEAKKKQVREGLDDLPLEDGAVITACQQACPTRAIAFGNINDPDSEVSQWRRFHELQFRLLDELNTRPRTSYLARVINTNTNLEPPKPSAHDDDHKDGDAEEHQKPHGPEDKREEQV